MKYTNQRRSSNVAHTVGDCVQECLSPNCMRSKTALIKIAASVYGALGTVRVDTIEALAAVTAAVAVVTPTDTIALLQILGLWTYGFYDADAFMTEHHILGFLYHG